MSHLNLADIIAKEYIRRYHTRPSRWARIPCWFGFHQEDDGTLFMSCRIYHCDRCGTIRTEHE